MASLEARFGRAAVGDAIRAEAAAVRSAMSSEAGMPKKVAARSTSPEYFVLLQPRCRGGVRIDLRSQRFGLEPEITCKVARLAVRVYKVPIS